MLSYSGHLFWFEQTTQCAIKSNTYILSARLWVCFIDRCLSFFFWPMWLLFKEEFEDTKGVIRIRISKKNRQHNGQMKRYKRTNNDLQNIHIKL